jgi:outer membrane protein OmpA-like peptidoglycan-associated protein
MVKTIHALFLFWISVSVSPAQQNYAYQLFFETNQYTVSTDEQLKFSRFMKTFDTVNVSRISVVGYCDDRGNAEYNAQLSAKRALFADSLIPSITIPTVEGKGELPLLNNTLIDKQRANNRRVDVTVYYSPQLKNIQPAAVESKTTSTIDKPSPLSDDQKVGDKVTLENILFIGGRHVLLEESYDNLDLLTSTLLEKKKYHICILGHICCIRTGNDGLDYDTGIKNLSVARARVIYEYLISKGVSPDRLTYKGMKAMYPTGRGDKADRRVEIEITKIVSD